MWPSRVWLGGEGSRHRVCRVVVGAAVWPLIYLTVLKRLGRSVSSRRRTAREKDIKFPGGIRDIENIISIMNYIDLKTAGCQRYDI